MPAQATLRSLKRKPQAVVSLSFKYDSKTQTVDTAKPAAAEFEWFETDANREKWFDACTAWDAQDVADEGDLFHVSFEVTDTKAMTVGRVVASPAKAAAGPKGLTPEALKPLLAVVRRIKAGKVEDLLPKPEVKPRTAKAKVKPRPKKDAAAVVQKDGIRKGVRGVAKKAAPNADARAAALKARMAGRQEQAKAEASALDAALAGASA